MTDPGSRATANYYYQKAIGFRVCVIVFLVSTGRNRDFIFPVGQSLKREFLGHLPGTALHLLPTWAMGAAP